MHCSINLYLPAFSLSGLECGINQVLDDRMHQRQEKGIKNATLAAPAFTGQLEETLDLGVCPWLSGDGSHCFLQNAIFFFEASNVPVLIQVVRINLFHLSLNLFELVGGMKP